MKLTNKILAVALSVVTLSSCGDFLTEDPTTSLTKEKAYTSESSIVAVLNGAYSAAHSTYSSSLWMLLTQCAGPTLYRAVSGSGLTVDQRQAIMLDYRSNTGSVMNSFQSCYTAINQANNILEELPKHADNFDPQFVNHIMGNAYFLRGVGYFYMVRIWGGVPLVTKPPREQVEFHKPRASLDEMYKQIISDFEQAHELMPEKGETRTAWPDQIGYPHRWAPLAMLSKVYLQMACIKQYPGEPFADPHFTDNDGAEYTTNDLYSLALNTAEEVMRSGKYELLPKFSDVFYIGKQNTVEGIYETQASLNSGSAPNCMTYSVPNYSTKYATTNNSVAGRVRPMHEVFWTFNSEDPRRDASFIYQEYIRYVNANPPARFAIFPSTTVTSASSDSGFPYFRKYFDSLYNATGTNAHFYVMRYADVYLIASEAANEIGEEGKALQYLNKIRERARDKNGNGNPNDAGEIYPMNQLVYPGRDDFRNIIMQERIYELLGENQEWFDTRRRGVQWFIDNVSTPHNTYMKDPASSPSPSVYYKIPSTGYFEFPTDPTKVKTILLLPISIKEIQTNDAVSPNDQNPGYN